VLRRWSLLLFPLLVRFNDRVEGVEVKELAGVALGVVAREEIDFISLGELLP